MQTDLFLERFDDLLTTPGDVTYLEAAVLQLAVQGQLVPQDPDDEPATVLLERTRGEKERLIRKGEIRKPKLLPPIKIDEAPYELPKGWVWTRLGEVSQIIGGGTPKTKVPEYWSENGIPWLTPADLYRLEEKTISKGRRDISELGLEKSSARLLPKGSVLFSSRAPIGYVAIAANSLATNQGFKSCIPYIMDVNEYLYYFLKYAGEEIDRQASGTTFKEVSGKEMSLIVFPLSPLAEQKRIVAKVDALLAQTRALAARLEQADAALVPAAQAAFQSLVDAPDAAAQHAAWQRVATHFDALTGDPRTIEALKQTVLQLAVQGKLVPQDPDDEPAGVLLERIEVEKTRLVQEGRVRKSKPLPPIKDDELLYVLPDSWEWARAGNIADHRLGKMLDKRKNKGEYLPYLRNLNVQWLRIDLDDILQMRFEDRELEEYRLEQGDLLICEGGEPGRCAIWKHPDLQMMFQKAIHRVRPFGGILPKYLLCHLWADAGRGVLEGYFTGATIKHFTGKALARYVFALPPLAEQKRIVAKVEALHSLCDALAAQVVGVEEVRRRLLQAVLNGG